jgi:preprotein translocase subunit SecA
MAGRGTDIILGGKENLSNGTVAAAGGLHVIGTNRHESRRIDDQLRGRSGRQGDPGSSKFIISLEDQLMVKYKLKELLPPKLRDIQQDEPITNYIIQSRIAQAQRIIEGQMYDIRRTLCDYTNFIEEQRKYFLGKRQKVLYENIHLQTISMDPPETAEMIIAYPNIKKFILNQYDLTWAKHLNFASELREGIHLVRLGGENPVRVFQKKTHEHFNQVQTEMEKTIINFIAHNPDGKDLKIKRPSSTWTYMVNDNPFGNRLSVALLSNSNIGFQTDPLSLGILLIIGFVKRIFPRKKKNDLGI